MCSTRTFLWEAYSDLFCSQFSSKTRDVLDKDQLKLDVALDMLMGDDVIIRHFEELEYWGKTDIWKDVLAIADNPKLADFKLVANDSTEVHCHKIILAARSTVFKTMFEVCCEQNMVGL